MAFSCKSNCYYPSEKSFIGGGHTLARKYSRVKWCNSKMNGGGGNDDGDQQTEDFTSSLDADDVRRGKKSKEKGRRGEKENKKRRKKLIDYPIVWLNAVEAIATNRQTHNITVAALTSAFEAHTNLCWGERKPSKMHSFTFGQKRTRETLS